MWIECKHELPESRLHVLGTDGIEIHEMYVDYIMGKLEWFKSDGFMTTMNITHWMKMPHLPHIKEAKIK